MNTFYNIIDKMDMSYWLILAIGMLLFLVIVYLFYMKRSKKELEYLDYEIKENQRERKRYAKMREELRKF